MNKIKTISCIILFIALWGFGMVAGGPASDIAAILSVCPAIALAAMADRHCV